MLRCEKFVATPGWIQGQQATKSPHLGWIQLGVYMVNNQFIIHKIHMLVGGFNPFEKH